MNDKLIIKNAKVHNLKNVSLEMPKNKLVVFTGISGSGKSSLAFDTIYAEGQRRYIESLSSYARQFLGLMEKPDVEYIEGLSPAISIDQKTTGHNPRSTVGTVTEIYDYLRLLFARIGKPHDPKTGKLLVSQTVQEIVEKIEKMQGKLLILAPIVRRRKGTYEELFQKFLSKGFVRVRVDGNIYPLDQDIKLDRFKAHDIDIVIDRLSGAEISATPYPLKSQSGLKGEQLNKIESDSSLLPLNPDSKVKNIGIEGAGGGAQTAELSEYHKRITDSVELALSIGNGQLGIANADNPVTNHDLVFSESFVLSDGTSFPKLEPHLFSFNAPSGACPECAGLGFVSEIDENTVYNPKLTISEGSIYPWSRSWDMSNGWYKSILDQVCKEHKIKQDIDMGKLSEAELKIIMYGTGDKEYTISTKDGGRSFKAKYEGVINNLIRRYRETDSDSVREEIAEYMTEKVCPVCKGARLRKESLCVKIFGKNILEVTSMNIEAARIWISSLETGDKISNQDLQIAKQVLKEIINRLQFLESVGLNYLSLNRTARTLSGGEAQRIRLASQIGSGLSGVMYILDEPSIGLHQKDNEKLIETLKRLRDLGNTVIVVEHDSDTIRAADWIVEIGPAAGEHGGEIVFNGTISDFLKSDTLTAKYLNGKSVIDKKEILKLALDEKDETLNDMEVKNYFKNKPKEPTQRYLEIVNASENNLKNISVKFPLQKFISVTGASGSGKSTLINDILAKYLMKEIYGSKDYPGEVESIEGVEYLDKVVIMDQSPIGRTPRSNPATYTGVFQHIREIFASTKESKIRGYKLGRFSFNTKGGRCEKCRGDGVLKISMQFLPDVYVTCEQCNGKRYNADTLAVDYKGKNISDILDMTVEEASAFFSNISYISTRLKTLEKVGLGYIKLGQSATTLSGGEAQRVKLATELCKRQTGKTVYILDEPTTGLHFADIEKLLLVLHSLVLKGNTVIVIEHNLDVIKTSDWIIDLGPEGGERGGQVLVEGTVEDVIKEKKSYTGRFLKGVV